MAPDNPNDLLFLSVPALFYVFLHRIYLIPSLFYLYQHRNVLSKAARTMGLVRPNKQNIRLAVLASVILTAVTLLIILWIPVTAATAPVATTSTAFVVGKGIILTLRGGGEEVLFRGFVQGIFAKRFPPLVALGAQAVLSLLPVFLFTLVDSTFWVLLPPQAVAVVVLGLLRYFTKGIAAPLIAHGVLNVVIVVAAAYGW